MAKCYIYVCAGCDLLAQSERSDALTCSTACRVTPTLSAMGISKSMSSRAQAIADVPEDKKPLADCQLVPS